MYKIINQKLIKSSILYFIFCVTLSLAFQKPSSINELLSFYSLTTLTNPIEFLVMTSRLILFETLVVLIYQDFMDLYGAKYIFINIRKLDNQHYYCYVMLKEMLSLMILSFINLFVQYLSSPTYDSFDFYTFINHYLSYVLWAFLLFQTTVFLTIFTSQVALNYLLLVITLIYFVSFSVKEMLPLLCYLNFNHSWLIIQILDILGLFKAIYHFQQLRR